MLFCNIVGMVFFDLSTPMEEKAFTSLLFLSYVFSIPVTAFVLNNIFKNETKNPFLYKYINKITVLMFVENMLGGWFARQAASAATAAAVTAITGAAAMVISSKITTDGNIKIAQINNETSANNIRAEELRLKTTILETQQINKTHYHFEDTTHVFPKK